VSSLAPPPPDLPEAASSLERMRHARRVARGDYGPVPPLKPARDHAELEYGESRRRLAERFSFTSHDPTSHDRTIRWVRFWDTAAKAGQRCDYWAGALVGKGRDGSWYLASVVQGRWEYPEAKRRVLQTAAADGPDVPVVIEDSASGSALLQDLRCDRVADGYLIRAEKVAADKAVRAGAWASLAEAGRFYLLRGAWNGAFLQEVESFPYGAHDDQVDAVSGAHAYLFRTGRVPRVIAFAGRAR
jgi:predicted phage terminase large subunit-like protein